MTRGPSPTVRRRRLAAELRRFREAAVLTIDEVADKLECSASKVSRIETGHVSVTPRDVRDMAELYGIVDEQRDALVQLAREARQKGWWHAYNEVFTGAFVGLEADSSSLRAFQALIVPGLLQTPAYTRAVLRAIRPDAQQAEIDMRVEARQTRQRLLTDARPPEYWAVMDEAVLRRLTGGPEVMAEQLLKMVQVAELPNVNLQVVPFAAGAHAGMEAPFLILGFPDQIDPDVVYVESTANGVYLESPADVHKYSLLFDHLRAAALRPDDSVGLVQRIAEELIRDS
ncbi:helix-turn-helix domain-containing protein [Actinokineospora globicatena]|uniref:Transcriptional regulator n=1 Tax=Actinokineospora globicatena TaxID=103729 RepID=A0A9W6QI06_9PSEU|nr:helix-turn-helix transcriptional regulator [Actinokineospora globicatena]MCP2304422.1 Helix-turn-helix domain-containing protein [Actinokineospora globicatena]GLW78212.1 transcriptional regulator [Actinokineospora globicatena]GLW85122.1 transcriptional regulator [Actinokineospora globicatena]GLW90818.1 transcriptional regulator [Actinokineospora globicatena]